MSKAYIVTAVDQGETCDGKARTLGIHFAYEDAARAQSEDMTTYRNTCLALSGKEPLSYNEGMGYCYINDRQGCEWNIEAVDIRIPLTPLQLLNLNGIAAKIEKGEDDYFSYEQEDTLSAAEDEYLRAWLLGRGIVIDKEAGVELRGETAREWLAKHGKENGNG